MAAVPFGHRHAADAPVGLATVGHGPDRGRGGEDPLAPASARLSQGRARYDTPVNGERRSGPGLRPFGLRFATDGRPASTSLPAWRFDEQRQIGVDPNGNPWYRGIVDMTMKTTGPSPDGGGSTGGEEWSGDYLTDQYAGDGYQDDKSRV